MMKSFLKLKMMIYMLNAFVLRIWSSGFLEMFLLSVYDLIVLFLFIRCWLMLYCQLLLFFLVSVSKICWAKIQFKNPPLIGSLLCTGIYLISFYWSQLHVCNNITLLLLYTYMSFCIVRSYIFKFVIAWYSLF